MLLLAALVLFATTRARLSQYEPVTAPSSTFVKASKLTECRPKLEILPDLEMRERYYPESCFSVEPLTPATLAQVSPAISPLPPPLRV